MTSSPFAMLQFGHLTVQVQVGPMTAENMREHLDAEGARLRQAIAEADKTDTSKGVVIVDGSVELVPPPSVRKMQAEWIEEHYEALRATVGAMGFVVPGPVSRGALTAALWVSRMPMPFTMHERLELALDWAITEVDRQQGEVPHELLMGGTMIIERAKHAAIQAA